jgi:hypothetical protein
MEVPQAEQFVHRQCYTTGVWPEVQTALKEHALTVEQLSGLVSVDAILSKMTQENNMALWDEPGVDHPRWLEVRESAKEALGRFGWRLDAPPKDRAIYVRPPGA